MSEMFHNCDSFNKRLYFDTSNVTNMEGMFYCCEKFNQPIHFNTSSVTTMRYMFHGCEKFNRSIQFDSSSTEDMEHMFSECKRLNSNIKLSTSNVKDMSFMFFNCENFNKDISQWDLGNCIYQQNVFTGCPIDERNKPLFRNGQSKLSYDMNYDDRFPQIQRMSALTYMDSAEKKRKTLIADSKQNGNKLPIRPIQTVFGRPNNIVGFLGRRGFLERRCGKQTRKQKRKNTTQKQKFGKSHRHVFRK